MDRWHFFFHSNSVDYKTDKIKKTHTQEDDDEDALWTNQPYRTKQLVLKRGYQN